MQRNLLLKSIVLFVTMLMFSFWVNAQIFVSDWGSDTSFGTESNPYLTIQHAIDVAVNGDEVIVTDGIYSSPTSINFLGKEIIVRSQYGPQNCEVENTGSTNVFVFQSGETNLSILEGFQIYGGDNGVFVDQASPEIRNCVIQGNLGMGINIVGGIASPTPGITMIYRNQIYWNDFNGIQIFQYCTVDVINNTIFENGSAATGIGSGIQVGFATVNINTNIIVQNEEFGIYDAIGGSPIINTYNDVWNNYVANYNAVTADASEISVDPMFVNPGLEDFSLLAGSPCIDAGDPGSNLDSDGTTTDMGAIYFPQGAACPMWIYYTVTDESGPGKYDGSIEVLVQDGVGPFNFMWSNGENAPNIYGLPSGDYWLTVTDAEACEVVEEIWVGQVQACDMWYTSNYGHITQFGLSDGFIEIYPYAGIEPYSITWNTGDTVFYLYDLAAGYYTFTLTDNVGCEIVDSLQINEQECYIDLYIYNYNVSAVGLSDGSIEVIANYGVPPYQFLWSNGETTALIDNLAIGEYIVTVTDSVGCSVTEIIWINNLNCYVWLQSFLYHTSGNANMDGMIEVFPRDGDPPYSFLWSNGETTSIIDSLGVGEYSVTVTDNSACTFAETYNLYDQQYYCDIYGNFNWYPGNSGCLSIAFDVWAYNNDRRILYEWNMGDGVILYDSTYFNYEYAAPGTYWVTMTATDAFDPGCTFSETLEINVLPPVTADFTYDIVDSRVHFIPTITGGSGDYNVNWDFGDGYGTGFWDPEHVYSTTGDFIVTLTVGDYQNYNCNFEFIDTITITTLDTCLLTGYFYKPYPVMNCLTYSFGAEINNHENPYEINWDFGDGTFAADSMSFNHSFPDFGAYKVCMTVTDPNVTGCEINFCDTVYVDSIWGDFTYYIDEWGGYYFVANGFGGSGMYDFDWDFGDGGYGYGQEYSYYYFGPGVYNVCLTIRDQENYQCLAIYCQEIYINEIQFYIDYMAECPPVNVTFTNSSMIYGYTGTLYYEWWINDYHFIGETLPDTVLWGGEYQVRLEAFDDNGPLGTYEWNFWIQGYSGDFYISTGDEACPDEEVTFKFFEFAYGIEWYSDGVLFATNIDKVSRRFAEGVYEIMLVFENNCGIDTAYRTLTVTPAAIPQVNFFIEGGDRFCPGDQVRFSTKADYLSYFWQFGDNLISDLPNPIHEFMSPGEYQVTLTATNQCGNSGSTTRPVWIEEWMWADAGFDMDRNYVCPNEPINFNAYGVGSFYWDFGDGGFSTKRNPTYAYSGQGTYMVTLYVTNGCGFESSQQQQVNIVIDATANDFDAYFGFELDYNTAGEIDTLKICPGAEIFFENRSWWYNEVMFHWEFGDGMFVDEQENVSHMYASDGIFEVQLILFNKCGASDTARRWVWVDSNLPPLANLEITPYSICPGEQVYFWDNEFDWTDNHNYYSIWFGDGDSIMNFDYFMDSILQVQGVHSYPAIGEYDVTFMATNYCGNSITLDTLIVVNNDAGRVPFYYINNSTQDEDDGDGLTGDVWIYEIEPGLFAFLNIDTTFYTIGISDEGSNSEQYILSFGAVAVDETSQTVTFVQAGGDGCDADPDSYIYSFTSTPDLSFTNVNDTCSERIDLMTGGVFYQVQSGECLPDEYWDSDMQICMPDYDYKNRSGCPGDPVSFMIVGGISYEWHFLDTITSIEQYPYFVYNEPGIYEEYVIATNSCGRVDTLYTTVEIDTTNIPDPGFWMETNGEPRAETPIQFRYNNDYDAENINFLWEFSDGAVYTEMNPVHIFAYEGEYWVNLTVSNGCGTSQYDEWFWVAPPPFSACDAYFTYYVNDSTKTVYYSFEGSDNITNWQWSFGDGTISDEPYPSHQYEYADFFEVCLNVYDSVTACVAQSCQIVPVLDSTVVTCYAAFDYYVVNDTVFFYNNSEGSFTNVAWFFDDGTNSHAFEPVHIYGRYDYFWVCLQIYDETTGCFDEYCRVVEVLDTNFVACKSNFEYFIDNRQVYFTSLIEGSYTDISWDFGDGSFAHDLYPNHFYVDPGWYEVCLSIFDQESQCFDNFCLAFEIIDTTVVSCNAGFEFFIDSLTVYYNNTSSGTFDNVYWEFGDGSWSYEFEPVHTYPHTDYYGVYMGIYDDSSGCFDDYWTIVPVIDTNVTVCKAQFGYYISDSIVYFDNISEGGYTDVFWTFGDGGYSEEIHPDHVYEYYDYFEVCLSIFDSVSQCFDEHCEIIMVLDTITIVCNAEFTSYVDDLNIHFDNVSAGSITSYFWSFGDGNYSAAENPDHTYSDYGYYDVCLTVFDEASQCTDDFCKEVVIIDTSGFVACKAGYEKYIDNLTVYFTDISAGNITNYLWSFGDGSYSIEASPVHIYEYSDYFTVCLTVLDADNNCVNDYCEIVTVVDSNIIACRSDFEFFADNLDVYFTNVSEGNVSDYFWDFGDGTYSSEPNPYHTYGETNYYNICLTVFDDASGCIDEICQIAIVIDTSEGPACNADFTAFSNNLDVTFTNNSEGDISDYLWEFDDGSFAYDENPTHSYADPGYYYVCLTVYDSGTGCMDDNCKFVVVIDTSGVACNANFDAFTENLNVAFTNTSEGNITDYFWDFGDGSFAYGESPSHTYDYPGYYDVCLSVYDDVSGCLGEFCEYVVVIDTAIASCRADFSSFAVNTQLQFDDLSVGNITDYFWDFGDGYYAYEANPVHTYNYPDYYWVSMSVYDDASGCLDEFGDIVVVIDSSFAMCNASFDTYNENLDLLFTNKSEGDITDYFWDFDDGYYAYNENPVHTYSYPGYYWVSLSVYDDVSVCIDYYEDVVVVWDNTQAMCNAEFENYNENLDVYFTNKSVGDITDYFWSFGDGYYSYEQNPTHTYTYPDYYEVWLSIYDDSSACLDEFVKVVVVVDTSGPLCQAQFEFYSENRIVSFTNTSTGDFTDVFWDFDDGYYSSENNPVHTYTDPGYYQVWLTIYDDLSGCLDDKELLVVVVDITQAACNAEFSSYTDNLTVNFDNASLGSFTDYFWDFGDGYYSFDENTSHAYTDAGYYQVWLTVYDEVSGCLDDYMNVVFVYNPAVATCNAQFSSYTELSTVYFTSEAIGEYTDIFWDFDDGFNSNELNPAHVYDEPGYYEVCFTVIDTTTECFDTWCGVIFVTGADPDPVVCKADFSFFPDNATLTVTFTDESFGGPDSWYWDFGDNTPASTVQNPVYTYSNNGYYHVALTIMTAEGCLETFLKWIAIGSVDSSHTAFFTYFADSLTSTAHFNNKSLGSISAYHWDFGDGYSSLQEEPSHTYQDTGYYAVCLTTVGANTGDSITYCNDIRLGNALDDRCLFSCVWPGDANNSLEANHYDIMTIGLNYGLTGPVREDASINWWGQFAQNWSTFQWDGTNNKHGDCNGDGVINLDDTLAIFNNFAFSHYYQPDKEGVEWVISVEWVEDTTLKAAGRKMSNRLTPPGKNTHPVIYGIGYEVEVIGGEGIIFSSIVVSYEDSWFGTDGGDMLTFFTADSALQTFFFGMTRLDHTDTTGSGSIATVYFEFAAGYENDIVTFNVTTLGGMDANGVYINVGEGFMVDLGNDIEFCEGESATITAPAGYVSYLWNDGSTNNELVVTASGTYSVIITDANGITGTDAVTVTVHALPAIELGIDKDICEGEYVNLDAGSGFVSYLWSTDETAQSISVNTTNAYSVTVTDANACQGVDTVNVTVQALPVVAFGNDISIDNEYLLDAGSGFTSYLWSDNSTGQTLLVTVSGIYSVTVTNEWGCEGYDEINVTITGIASINGHDINVELYPNPNKGLFNLNINSPKSTEMILQITDLRAQIVYTKNIDQTTKYQTSIDVSDLADGVYYLKLITADYIKVKKLIINK